MLSVESKKGATPERGWWLNEPASSRLAFGIVLHQINGNWTVRRPLIGSPAEKAGVRAGHQLLSVDGYGLGDPYELQVLMQLDNSPVHAVVLRTTIGDQSHQIEKRPLRDLLEFDYDNGGATLGGCVGCLTCRPLTIGATDCSSGCPGNYCTIG